MYQTTREIKRQMRGRGCTRKKKTWRESRDGDGEEGVEKWGSFRARVAVQVQSDRPRVTVSSRRTKGRRSLIDQREPYISREFIFIDYYSLKLRIGYSLSCACPVFTNPRARFKVKCKETRRAKRISLLGMSDPR